MATAVDFHRHGQWGKSGLGVFGDSGSLRNFVRHFIRHFVVGIRVVVLVFFEVVFFHEFAVEEVELALALVGGKRGEDHGDGR